MLLLIIFVAAISVYVVLKRVKSESAASLTVSTLSANPVKRFSTVWMIAGVIGTGIVLLAVIGAGLLKGLMIGAVLGALGWFIIKRTTETKSQAQQNSAPFATETVVSFYSKWIRRLAIGGGVLIVLIFAVNYIIRSPVSSGGHYSLDRSLSLDSEEDDTEDSDAEEIQVETEETTEPTTDTKPEMDETQTEPSLSDEPNTSVVDPAYTNRNEPVDEPTDRPKYVGANQALQDYYRQLGILPPSSSENSSDSGSQPATSSTPDDSDIPEHLRGYAKGLRGVVEDTRSILTRLKDGDPTAWQENEDAIRRLNAKASQLQSQVASDRIRLDLQQKRQASEWLNSSRQAYSDAQYWAKERKYDRAASSLREAEGYRRDAERLLDSN